mmetsp:Transcript_10668/g.15842  ORF Transcript_10668/g.15842 Transcript_10668/m.15842 type:complete len:522 (-) Transcript_10668:109-1674(-)
MGTPIHLTIIGIYLAIEIAFCIVYYIYILPRANRQNKPSPYRDYGNDRLRLLRRILGRLKRTSKSNGKPYVDTVNELILGWFHRLDSAEELKSPLLKKVSSLSSSNSSFSTEGEGGPTNVRRRKRIWEQNDYAREMCYQNDQYNASVHVSSDDEGEEKKGIDPNDTGAPLETHPVLMKDNLDDFLCWAFFSKSPSDMLPLEQLELSRLYREVEAHLGFTFKSGRNHQIEAKRLTLEDVNALHRPLLVYIAVGFLRGIASVALWAMGFRRYSSINGPAYWHRPSANDSCGSHSPLLFFHGISPGGYVMYLPMVLWGLCNDGRAAFLFENNPISCRPSFHADTEHHTVQVVVDAVNQHIGSNENVTICGHSFGSCPMTWLIRSPEFISRIQQIVLLDPVTIVLHEPDVIDNFIYGKRASNNSIGSAVIRLAASSELFTNHYLRRHFAWYNSELWLEDIPPQARLTVCIAEKDDIINAKKVKGELDVHKQTCPHMSVIEWSGVGHGYCATSPSAWAEIKETMKM